MMGANRQLVRSTDQTDMSKVGGVTWSRRQAGSLDLCRGGM